jgi:nicotinate (nicotinamide) nucleotide adenylyltransferase
MKEQIILILSGSFNPVHYGHLELLIKAKEYMEKHYNYIVIYGFLSPSSDKYVQSKLHDEAIPLSDRINMCNMISKEYTWIKVFKEGLMSGSHIANILTRQYKMNVYEIGGADFINKTKINNNRKIICFPRKDYNLQYTNTKLYHHNIIIIEEEIKDVSSTLIRKLIKNYKEIDLNLLLQLTSIEIINYMII